MKKLVLVHGSALSNLPLFVAAAGGYFARHGLSVHVPTFDAFSSTVTMLRSGAADLGTSGFTQALADGGGADPLRIVAGSGVRGMALVGRSGSGRKLAGCVIGTFADDPMEVLLHDILDAAGLVWSQVPRRYFESLATAVAALRDGRIDALTVVEPWIARLRGEGFEVISDGTDIWGPVYPDTVLVARASFLAAQPEVVDATLAAMLDAQDEIVRDPGAALRVAAQFYPGFSIDELRAGLAGQPPMIDIRALAPVIAARLPTVRILGQGNTPGDGMRAMDFTRLTAVLAVRPASSPNGLSSTA